MREAGEAEDERDEIAAGLDGRVGAEIVGVGGRMSEPYVGIAVGAAGSRWRPPPGPPNMLCPNRLPLSGRRVVRPPAEARLRRAHAGRGTVDAGKSDVGG